MGRRLLLLTALCAATLTSAPGEARAQDDWDVKRDPFDKRLVGRYKAMLKKNPHDADALRKLVTLYKKYRTLNQLKTELTEPRDYGANFVLARIHEWQEEYDKAVAFYEHAEQLNPKEALVPATLAPLYRRTGDDEKARAAYERALSLSRDKSEQKQFLKALLAMAADKNDVPAVEGYIKKYVAIDPKDVQARLDFADTLIRLKQVKRGIDLYKEAEGQIGADPELRVDVNARLGAAHESAGDDDAALAVYQRTIKPLARDHHLRRELVLRIVDIYRRRQTLPALVQELEKQWPAGSRTHFEWDLLAQLYEETGNQDGAIAAYRKALGKAPTELDTHRRLITLLGNAGRDAEALKQYEEIVRIAPGDPNFQLDLAQKYWANGDHKKALEVLGRLESRFRGDAGVYGVLAELYTRWGREDLALKAYTLLTQFEPNEVSHLVNLGEQYFQKDDRKKAIAIWKRIVQKETPDNYARLAQVYAEHDMLSEALVTYSKAIKLDPKKEAFYRGRAVVYERQKQPKDAVADWERVLSLLSSEAIDKPRVREARQRIVNLLERQGGTYLSERQTGWKRDFEKEPPLLASGYFLVESYLRQNRLADARAVLEAILARKPDDNDSMHALVNVHKAERNYDKAIEVLTQLAQKSPGLEREYYNQIAELKTILHEDSAAIEYAKKALDKNPNDPMGHQRLAERYESMQQYPEAIAAYEKALEHDPRKYEAYFALARLYRNQGQREKAAAVYHKLLQRAPDEDILYKAGREAISLQELDGTLPALEQVLAPLCFTMAHKKVYRRLLVELYARYVPDLVNRWRRREGDNLAAIPLELKRLGTHGLKPLLEALNDEKDPSQQRMAVQVLGYLGNQGAAAPLVRIAKEGKETTGEPARLQALLPTLDWDVRVEALVAAGRLGDARTISDLTNLAKHKEASMREAAVFALGMTGDRRTVASLSRALDDTVDGVQVLACLGLGRVESGAGKDVEKRLIGVVNDPARPDLTRAACAFALGLSGSAASVEVLLRTLGEGNDEAQRTSAWALGRLHDRRALPALFHAYFTQGPRVREASAWAIGEIHAATRNPVGEIPDYPMVHGRFDARSAVEQLLSRLQAVALPARTLPTQEDVIVSSIQAALDKHRDVAVRILEELDADPDQLALGVLSETPDLRAKELAAQKHIGSALGGTLARLLDHRDTVVRMRALSVLAKTEAKSVPEAVKRALADPTASVRAQAMLSAAVYVRHVPEDPDGLTARIQKELDSREWQDRVAAARALGEFRKSGVIPALSRALESDQNSFVREAAANSLGLIGSPEAAPALTRASNRAHEPIADVRAAATRALSTIQKKR